MDANASPAFLRFFSKLQDPRRHNVRHRFIDLLTIAILAVLCRADDFDEMVLWAHSRHPWLATFLELPGGIPCADTFRRLFARIDPVAFEHCFIAWTTDLASSLQGQVVALDGKTLRRSFEHAWENQSVHLVSAWASDHQIVLGQLAVQEKSNEITALPGLIDLLNLKGATVTIDAMGTQRQIAAAIVAKKADYVLAVKENQPQLSAKVKTLLDEAILQGFKDLSHGRCQETCGGHGRIETRTLWVTDQVQWLGQELLSLWPGLKSVAAIELVRTEDRGKRSCQRRYFISSLGGAGETDAAGMMRAIREHWGIENRLHW